MNIADILDTLNEQQRICAQAVADRQNVCILGAAGTGKSFLIKSLVKIFQRQKRSFQILAPTGVSAVQVGGMTVHRYFKIPPGVYNYTEYSSRPPSRFGGKAPDLPSVFVIDEISMIHPEVLQLMSDIVCNTNILSDEFRPFGGTQVVLLGDFFQLSYIDTRPRDKRCTVRLFETDVWKELSMSVHRLTKIVRQSEADFIRPLTSIRIGRVSSQDVADLILKCSLKEGTDLSEYVKLFSRNEEIEYENKRNLAAIDEPEMRYTAEDWTRSKEDQKSLDNMLAKNLLVLKKGCRVMLIKNMPEFGVFNGSLGTVMGFDGKRNPIVKFDETNTELVIERVVFEINTYVKGSKPRLAHGVTSPYFQPKSSSDSVDEIVCRKDAYRKQYPLVLSYAISIHKSQGMTISKVYVDLQGVFAFGQVYTALSRAKSMDGLIVCNFNPRSVPVDSRVNKFYRGLIDAERSKSA